MAGSCLPVLGAVLLAPVLPKMQEHFAAVPGAKTLVPLVLIGLESVTGSLAYAIGLLGLASALTAGGLLLVRRRPAPRLGSAV